MNIQTPETTPTTAIADAYWRDGFVFGQVLGPEEAFAIRTELERIEHAYPSPRHPLVTYLRANGNVVVRTLDQLARHPAVLDAVSAVLGPNLLCWGAEVFAKEAHSDRFVGWHQDITYWGLGETDNEVTAWIAPSPSTIESGCVRFVAGSHRRSIVPHRDTSHEGAMLSRGQEIAVDVDEAEATPVILQPGQMSLHHGRMFHASDPNRSDDRRIGIAIRYLRPDVDPEGRRDDYAMLVGVRIRMVTIAMWPGPPTISIP